MTAAMHGAPDWLTLRQVSHLLGLSRTTLWRMEKRGELPVRRFGSSVRVPRAWVEGLEPVCLRDSLSA